jgi:hypothetical protein
MSKPFSTLGSTASASGTKFGLGALLFLVLAVIIGIALFTHGVPPAVGVPIALVAALVVDKVLFGSWK